MLQTDLNPTQVATRHVPRGLDEMAPGPVLAAYLSSIDVHTVSGYDRVVVLRAHQRMASHYQAHTYTDMTAITQALADDGESYEEELASAEIRAALNLTRRAATDGPTRNSPTTHTNGQAPSATPTPPQKTRHRHTGQHPVREPTTRTILQEVPPQSSVARCPLLAPTR